MSSQPTHIAFADTQRLALGSKTEIALAAHAAASSGHIAPILIFEAESGRQVDLDLRGTQADILARFATTEPTAEPRGRGRPKLGVTAREVTLMPRHWDWLAGQPGGASTTLRRLVDEARRTNAGKDHKRQATEAAYRFMSALAGDLPQFEEASRALFAGDQAGLKGIIAAWPIDVREQVLWLASGQGLEAITGGD